MTHSAHNDLRLFLEKVDKLLFEMESWCASESLVTQRSPVSILEEDFGNYQTEQLKISTSSGSHVANIVPIGASILGANGRVDMEGLYDRIILVDLNAGGPGITTTTVVDGGERTQTQMRPFYKGIDEPGWYWIESRVSSRGHKLDRELFLDLLAEVSDYERN